MYKEDKIELEIKLIVPYSIKEVGYKLQDILGKEKVLIPENIELLFEFIKADAVNTILVDEKFLEDHGAYCDVFLTNLTMVLLTREDSILNSKLLNKCSPNAFLNESFSQNELKTVEEKIKEALRKKEEYFLFESLKNNLSKDASKRVVLDMDRAFDKEINLIKNDTYYQQIEVPNRPHQTMRLDMFYKPMELLSGDSYSVRKIGKDYIFCFLIDAMAKGVAAAITSTSSTSMLNYLLDRMLESGKFDLRIFLKQYIEYVKKELLEDEIVSAIFVVFDRNEISMDYASFGTPPILTYGRDGLQSINSNNMPICAYSNCINIDTISLKKARKMLLYSDGLCESEMKNGQLYRKELPDDFKKATNIVSFIDTMKQKIGQGNDDIAFFYVEAINNFLGVQQEYEIKSTREDIDDVLLKIAPFLNDFNVSPKQVAEISLTLTELLANALEHGSFGLSRYDKHVLIANDTFEEVMERYEENSKDIPINFKMRIFKKEKDTVFEAVVQDKGAGFDTKMLKNLVVNTENFNGRGFRIIRQLVDRFYFNEIGNQITIVKILN